MICHPYTPGQHATRFAEEGAALERIDDVPVVCTGLHSQLAPVCAALPGRRVAYVQLGGGALPVSLSDTVRAQGTVLLDSAIAVAPCVDGDLQCATAAGALTHAAARGAEGSSAGSGRGSSARGRAGATEGSQSRTRRTWHQRSVGCRSSPRGSRSGPRPRHRGLSHHTRSALALCLGSVEVAWPRLDRPSGVDVVEVDATGWEAACAPLPLDHMGRGPGERILVLRRLVRRREARGRVMPPVRNGALSSRAPCGSASRKRSKPLQEYRVALTPAGALELVQRGHEVVSSTARGSAPASPTRRTPPSAPGSLTSTKVWSTAELLLKVKADRAGVPAPAGGPDALHLPPHRRRRAAHPCAARVRRHRRRVRDRRDGGSPPAAPRADERGGGPPRAADGRTGAREGTAAAVSSSAACPACRPRRSSSSAAASWA